MKKRILVLLVLAQALSIAPVFASTRGRQNTAAGLTGAALLAWMQSASHGHSAGRRNSALLLTAGSVYAWHKYNQSKKADRRERERAAYYRGLSERHRRIAARQRSRAAYYRRLAANRRHRAAVARRY